MTNAMWLPEDKPDLESEYPWSKKQAESHRKMAQMNAKFAEENPTLGARIKQVKIVPEGKGKSGDLRPLLLDIKEQGDEEGVNL